MKGEDKPDVLTVAGFAFPESHIADRAAGVEMAERLFRWEVRGAEEAEVGKTFADHMVTAVALEDGAVAFWAWRGMIAQIGFGREVFECGLCVGRAADDEVTVPAMNADAAEGKGTAAADLEFRRLERLGSASGGDGYIGGGSGSGDDGFGTVVAEVV